MWGAVLSNCWYCCCIAGFVGSRDVDFGTAADTPVTEVMTKFKDLVVANDNVTLGAANAVLRESKKGCVLFTCVRGPSNHRAVDNAHIDVAAASCQLWTRSSALWLSCHAQT